MSTTRQLPEGQSTGEEGPLPARIEEARELSELLERIERASNADGTIEGRLSRIHIADRNPSIAVMVELPAEEDPKRFVFDRPKVWHPRYDFVRFCEKYGASNGDVDFLIENEVTVEVTEDDGDYELVYPSARDVLTRRERARLRINDTIEEVRDIEDGVKFVLWVGVYGAMWVMLAAIMLGAESPEYGYHMIRPTERVPVAALLLGGGFVIHLIGVMLAGVLDE